MSTCRGTPGAWLRACSGLVAFALTLVSLTAFAAAGDLDTGFAGRGWVELALPGRWVYVKSVIAEADGGVVALANARTIAPSGEATGWSVVVARWRSDGTPDPAFAGGGVLVIDVPGREYFSGTALHRTADGYLVAGWTQSAGANGKVALAHVLADGTLDPRFGTGGTVVHDFLSTPWEGIVAVVDDGAGYVALIHRTSTPAFFFARFTRSGDVDASFGTNGTTEVVPAAFFNVGADVVALPAGGVLAVGWAEPAPGLRDVGFVRLLPNGMPDATFGPGGVRRVFGPWNTPEAMALVPAGVVVVGGNFAGRIRYDGTPDPAFAFPGAGGPFPWLRAAASAGFGVYAAGETSPTAAMESLLVLIRNDGTLDRTFGTDGRARLSALGVSRAYTVRTATGGDVLVGGEIHRGGVPLVGFVARVDAAVPDAPAAAIPAGGPWAWAMLCAGIVLSGAFHVRRQRSPRAVLESPLRRSRTLS
jgi:uncharacterized delta-60 repeat protein